MLTTPMPLTNRPEPVVIIGALAGVVLLIAMLIATLFFLPDANQVTGVILTVLGFLVPFLGAVFARRYSKPYNPTTGENL